ncbi:MAG: hypothetical protein ACK45F_07865 [bacterium]
MAGEELTAGLTGPGTWGGWLGVPPSLEPLAQLHLRIHRLDRDLNPTAVFEVRTPEGELAGRAVERCDHRWLRWLKYTRLREVTSLVLHVEAADGTPAFTLQREWDWLDRKPVRALRPSGAGLLTFQRFRHRRFGLPLWGTRLVAPDGRALATLHTLQPWVFRDLHYQLRDPLDVPLADIVWSASVWSRPRNGEVRVHRPEALPPFGFLAAALVVGLWVARR